jgi:hypothetical protein
MFEKLFAAAVAALCAVLLVRLCLGPRRRLRFDALVRRAWHACRRWGLRMWHWRASRRDAARAADEAIERARSGVERDGNVYKPKSFRRPRKPH